jgi:hypothetical protein
MEVKETEAEAEAGAGAGVGAGAGAKAEVQVEIRVRVGVRVEEVTTARAVEDQDTCQGAGQGRNQGLDQTVNQITLVPILFVPVDLVAIQDPLAEWMSSCLKHTLVTIDSDVKMRMYPL